MKLTTLVALLITLSIACTAQKREDKFAPTSAIQLAAPIIQASPAQRLFSDSIGVQLELDLEGTVIRYTLDGTLPKETSPQYSHPITLNDSACIKAVAFGGGFRASEVASSEFRRHGQQIQSITVQPPPRAPYAGAGVSTLQDGVEGTADFRDGRWLGYQEPVTLLIDLGTPRSVTELVLGCRQDPSSWIFYPARVVIHTAVEGAPFEAWATFDSPNDEVAQRKSGLSFLSIAGPARTATLLQVEISPLHPLPDWHAGHPEGRGWLFLDEVLVP